VMAQDSRRTRLCGFAVVFNFELRAQTTLPHQTKRKGKQENKNN
jgi:hypothetical protein